MVSQHVIKEWALGNMKIMQMAAINQYSHSAQEMKSQGKSLVHGVSLSHLAMGEDRFP